MSTLQVTNIKKTGETASRDVSGVAAAWVNLNGTGTIAVRDSVNVSSITDGGTSAYAVNYSSAMSDANYSFVIGGGDVSTAMWVAIYSGGNLPTANYIAVRTYNAAVAGVDAAYVNLALLGDLA
jgi:hypothetical protein